MEKAEDPKSWRENIFRQIPDEFKIRICLGCGEGYYDCDCPAGSSEHLRNSEEITAILQERIFENDNI